MWLPLTVLELPAYQDEGHTDARSVVVAGAVQDLV